MATNVSSWRTEISSRLSRSVSTTVIDAAVVDSLRDFCEETHIWATFLDDIDIVAETTSYDLKASVQSSEEIVEIKSVRYKPATAAAAESENTEYYFLDPISEDVEEKIRDGSWIFDEADCPSKYYVDEDWNIAFEVIPQVASTDGLRVQIYAKPPIAATTCDTFFYRDHRDAITYGALVRVYERYGIVKDVAKAQYYEQKFFKKCADAKFIKFTGKTPKKLRVNLPRFV